jgi:hypothetical protein
MNATSQASLIRIMVGFTTASPLTCMADLSQPLFHSAALDYLYSPKPQKARAFFAVVVSLKIRASARTKAGDAARADTWESPLTPTAKPKGHRLRAVAFCGLRG